ncbi:MAG: site-specific integrase [Halobacteriales archaeon]|nr:site-specific integrase [Halobacteriales archaeon]
MPVNDPQDFEARRISQGSKIDELPEEKREPITDYIDEEIDLNELKDSTLTTRLSKLRILSKQTDEPLNELSAPDVKRMIRNMAKSRGWSNGTKRNYQKAMRRFYYVLGERKKKKRITLTATNTGGGGDKIHPDDLPDAEELRELIVEKSRNLRDKAMFTFMVETGCRISACLSLRIKDIDINGGPAKSSLVHFRDAKGLKGAENTTIPINYSVPPIRDYLREEHPDRENQDAPLFTKSRENYEKEEDNSLHPSLIRRRLTRITEDMDMDVHPHMLRHVRITNMRKQGWPDRLIKHYVALDENTNQLKRYSHVKQEEKNQQIAELQGMDTEEEDYTAELPECPNCSHPLSHDIAHKYCPNCGQQLELYDYPDWLKDWMKWREKAGLDPEGRVYKYFLQHPHKLYDDFDKIQEDDRRWMKHHMQEVADDMVDEFDELPQKLPESLSDLLEYDPIAMAYAVQETVNDRVEE